jgi:uncharacterized protein YjgD (DUF1641 family)
VTATDLRPGRGPADLLTERLDDPTVVAALSTLLDHAELLSTLVIGLAGFVERGDIIIDSVASGVAEIKAARRGAATDIELPSPSELASLVNAMTKAAPAINDVLDSSMMNADSVALLSLVSESAVEGTANARANGTSVRGLRATLKALKDPSVARGLGVMVEIAKALGRRVEPASP